MEDKSFSKYVTRGIKGVAIILMLLHHCFLGRNRWEGYEVSFAPFTEHQITVLANFSKICVAIFVFISAYGMAKSYLKFQNSAGADNNGKVLTKRAYYNSKTFTRLFKLLWGFWGSFAVWQIFSLVNSHFNFTNSAHNYASMYGTGPKSVLYFFTDAIGLAELFGTPTFNGTWWYMSLAIIIILIMPLLTELYKRFGMIVVVLAPLLPQFLGIEKNNLTRYLFIIMLGILCADKDILEKLYNFKVCKNEFASKAIKFVVSCALLYAAIKIRQYNGALLAKYVEVMDDVIPLFVIYFCYEFVVFLPIVKNILQLIGKHSTTIFLTHTFFRSFYFQDFIYSPKNAILIVITLLITSLIYAIIYDTLTEKIGYYKLCDRIICRVNKRLKHKTESVISK